MTSGTERLWPPAERRRWIAAFAVLALAMLASTRAGAEGPSSLEYPVKAAFLYKFGPFVEWPASAFESAVAPFVICIVGDDPFGPILDQAATGQHVGRHPVTVRRFARMERGGAVCQVLYAAGSKAQPPTQALAAVDGQPVLTVTDAAHDDGSRGIIHFVLENSRVRFEIDARAAAQNGLSISSKLLSLAVNARPAPEAAP